LNSQDKPSKNVITILETNVVDSGENERLVVTYNNLRDRTTPLIMDVEFSEGVEVVNSSASDGYKKEGENKWLFRVDGDKNNAVVSILLDYEEDDKNYTANIKATTDYRNYTSTEKLNEKKPIERVVDENGNDMIDDREILNAISSWQENGEIDGREVTIHEIMNIIDYWQNDVRFTPVYPMSSE
jgi:hypothetical protein